MKGSTHLAIGVAIGAAASLYYPFTLKHAALYLSVGAFSALSADLDGQSLLIGKLNKVSKGIREMGHLAGVLLLALVGYDYLVQDRFSPTFATVAVAVFLLGFIARQGVIRNALVSLIGAGLLYAGWSSNQIWLSGLGLFVAWVPWLKHRGMTHTVWALAAWGAIGSGLENHLGVEGIMTVAIVGYASHLIADTLTPQGVKWLYPILKTSFKLPIA